MYSLFLKISLSLRLICFGIYAIYLAEVYRQLSNIVDLVDI